MAIAERILTNADQSPLYNPGEPGAIRRVIGAATAAMDPAPRNHTSSDHGIARQLPAPNHRRVGELRLPARRRRDHWSTGRELGRWTDTARPPRSDLPAPAGGRSPPSRVLDQGRGRTCPTPIAVLKCTAEGPVGAPAVACRPRRKRQSSEVACEAVTGSGSPDGTDRVARAPRAVALARHFREHEGLSINQYAAASVARRRRSRRTLYDPTGEKARAVKARYVGVCRGCGAYTQPRNGKGDAYAYCKACHPGAIERRWTRERVLAAMAEWRSRYRPAAVVLRLVVGARASARGRCARAARTRRLARGERRHPSVRYLGCRPRGRLAGGRGAAGERPVVSDPAIGQ